MTNESLQTIVNLSEIIAAQKADIAKLLKAVTELRNENIQLSKAAKAAEINKAAEEDVDPPAPDVEAQVGKLMDKFAEKRRGVKHG